MQRDTVERQYRDAWFRNPSSAAAPVRRVSAAGRRPEARPGPVQSSRPLVHAMPSAGLPAGAVNPTGLDPRSPPRRRGPRQGCRDRSGGQRSGGAAPAGLGLDGVASGGRVVESARWDRTPREDATSSDAEGGSNAVSLGSATRRVHAQRARRLAQMAQAVEHATRAGCRPERRSR